MDEVEKLIKQLGDYDLYARSRAMNALIKIGAPAVPALIALMKMDNEALNDKDEAKEVRANAVFALGQIKDVRAVPVLIEALACGSSWVQERARHALEKIAKSNPGNVEIVKAVSALIGMLKYEDAVVRRKAVYALRIAAAILGDSTFVNAIADPQERIRQSELIRNSVIPELIGTLKDDKQSVRRMAAEALGEILEKCVTLKEVEEIETHLHEALNPTKKQLKKEEITAIGFEISNLWTAAAKKKNELAQDKGILLPDVPKPPKGRKGIYQATRVMRNG